MSRSTTEAESPLLDRKSMRNCLQPSDSANEWSNRMLPFLCEERDIPHISWLLHRQAYLSMLFKSASSSHTSGSNRITALLYFRTHLGAFLPHKATNALLPLLNQSPSLLDPILAQGRQVISRVFQTILFQRFHLPRKDLLQAILDVGISARRIFLESEKSLQRVQAASGVASKDLMSWVEVPVPDCHRHHSVFVCPVSRTCATKDNPPVRLLCGHVINQSSMLSLAEMYVSVCSNLLTLKCVSQQALKWSNAHQRGDEQNQVSVLSNDWDCRPIAGGALLMKPLVPIDKDV